MRGFFAAPAAVDCALLATIWHVRGMFIACSHAPNRQAKFADASCTVHMFNFIYASTTKVLFRTNKNE